MKILINFCVIILLSGSVFAQRADLNQFIMNYGQSYDFVSARSLGMAGSGLAGGQNYDALMLNPALLSNGSGLLSFAGGIWLNKTIEDRAYPYYDSFVGFQDYGSYAYNAYWKQNGWVTLQFNLPENIFPGLSFGFGYVPFRSFEYDYQEEVRDPVNKSDRLLGYNTLAQTGKLSAIPIAVAYRIFKSLYLGGQVSFLNGTLEYKKLINPKASEYQQNALYSVTEKELATVPVVVDFGFIYVLNQRLTVGGNVQLPYSLEFDQTVHDMLADSVSSGVSETLDYPLTVGAGIEYKFENVLAAKINVDFNYRFWSAFKVNGVTPNTFNDTYQVKLGVEHLFFDNVPLRAGFLYETLPQSASFTRSVLTVGSGFETRGVRINIAGGVSNFEYYQDDLFPEELYGLENRSDPDRIRVTNFYVRLDVNYALTLK